MFIENYYEKRDKEILRNKYEIIIYWSDEDDSYVSELPELPAFAAHGNTEEEALINAKEAINLWIDTAKEFGDHILEPKGRRLIFS